MADISVLDVQRILRDHAEAGHDIFTDPRTVHVGDPVDTEDVRPFGMALSHRLAISNDRSKSSLSSYLMHGEQPSGTDLNSYMDHGSEKVLKSRSADKLHPSHEGPFEEADHHSFSTVTAPDKDSPYTKPDHDIDYEQLRNNYLYELIGDEPSHQNIHNALKEQAKTPALYNFKNEDLSTRQNVSGWDHKKALKTMSHPLEPFSGLVHILHYPYKDYVYNPQTEQLHRI